MWATLLARIKDEEVIENCSRKWKLMYMLRNICVHLIIYLFTYTYHLEVFEMSCRLHIKSDRTTFYNPHAGCLPRRRSFVTG